MYLVILYYYHLIRLVQGSFELFLKVNASKFNFQKIVSLLYHISVT